MLLLLPAMAGAQPRTVALSDADKTDIARVEAYLNGITTMASGFVQVANGNYAQGRIFMSRPGGMRIEYEPPVPVLMVASGNLLMYHDRKLEQTSFMPVSKTPAHLLLRERIDLSDGVTIIGFERGSQALRLTLVDNRNPDAGSLMLVFADRPLELVKWRVIDAQGQQIDVALVEPQFGVALDRDLFKAIDPALLDNLR